jgi:Putative peptidoglycan binding domain
LLLPGSSKKILTVGCAVLLAAAAAPAQTSATPATKPTQAVPSNSSQSSASKTATHKKSRKSARSRKSNWRKHGQQKIDAQRTQEIQDALIREHYMQGESSGVWDDATEKAMQRYQADHGWQSKSTPDARALIKLGLGPDQGHLLNPDSAMTSTTPHPAASEPVTPKAPAVPATSTADPPSTQPQK